MNAPKLLSLAALLFLYRALRSSGRMAIRFVELCKHYVSWIRKKSIISVQIVLSTEQLGQ